MFDIMIKCNINELTSLLKNPNVDVLNVFGPAANTPEYEHAKENNVKAWLVDCVGNTGINV
jgi:hypothetical protein|tara:strand:- start:328 stop:510 length:183 start_codon:yes stop_codon:yes gene_type:complete